MTGKRGFVAGETAARFQIPERPKGAVSRGKLMEEFEKSREDVIVIRAAAGFGKTAVMAEFARRHVRRCGWYRMCGADNNPVSFYYGLCSAIAGIKDVKIPEIEEKRQREVEILEGWQRFLSFFVSQDGKEPFYVCLDEFQTISDERVYELIGELVDGGRGRVRLLLAVRGSVPPFLAAYRMQGRVRVVQPEQLRFTAEETRAFLKCLAGRPVTEEMAEEMGRYTGGWAAGLAFAGLEIRQSRFPSVLSSLNESSSLNDYIFLHLFRKLSCEIQVFLAEASVFDEIGAAFLNHVLGRSDAGRMLEYLARENVFLARRRDGREGYYFYPVFAVFLRGRIAAGRKEEIEVRAAEYYVRRREWDRAAACAAGCGGKGDEILAAIVEQKVRILCETGEGEIPGEWISRLLAREGELQAAALFWLYRYFRYRGENGEAMRLLSGAMEKAACGQYFELYAEYAYEQITYAREWRGPARAKELAGFAGECLAGTVTGHSLRITLRGLEYCLEMEDFAHLRRFLAESGRGDVSVWRFQELRRLVGWALRIGQIREGGTDGWREVTRESRRMARLSKVYAEYGFYCAVCGQYAGGGEGWAELAEEGSALGGGSVFARWMRLLLLLAACRDIVSGVQDGAEDAGWAEAEKEIRQIEEERIRMGLPGPALHNEDLCVLEKALSGSGDGERKEKALLRVKCLGAFEVEGANGRVAWRTRKTKELFACLFYEEGRGIARDALAERLWPERDCKKATVLFHTTMSYLRKALTQVGAAGLLIVENQTYALRCESVSSDLGRLLEWNACVQKRSLPEAWNVMEAAELYHECYLYGEDYAWLGEYREYVERIFLQTITGLAELKAESGDFSAAVLLMEKAAEVDRYAVPVAERLVEYLILNREVREAKKRYERMQKISREEFSQEPDGFDVFLRRARERYRGPEEKR